MKLQNNLLEACKAKQITLTALARAARVSQATLHGWSTGRSVQNLYDLKRVCAVLQMSIHELLFGCPDPYGTGFFDFQNFTGELKVTIHRINKKNHPS